MFTSDGKFLYSFGSRGEGNGQFNGPTGLAVDNLDNIVVADWGNSRLQVNCHQSIANMSNPLQSCANIQVFDQFGSFLTFVNTTSSGSGGSKIYGPQVTFKFSIAYFSVLIKHVCSMFIKK